VVRDRHDADRYLYRDSVRLSDFFRDRHVGHLSHSSRLARAKRSKTNVRRRLIDNLGVSECPTAALSQPLPSILPKEIAVAP